MSASKIIAVALTGAVGGTVSMRLGHAVGMLLIPIYGISLGMDSAIVVSIGVIIITTIAIQVVAHLPEK